MTQGSANLCITAGETFRTSITFTGVDLTGYSARCQFRRQAASDTVELELTDTNGRIVLTDAAAGQLEIRLPASITETLSGQYQYDLELVSADGEEVLKLPLSYIQITPEVTR